MAGWWDLKSRIPRGDQPPRNNPDSLNWLLGGKLRELEQRSREGKLGPAVRTLAQMPEEERRAIVEQLQARERARRRR